MTEYEQIAQMTAFCIDCTYRDDWDSFIQTLVLSEDVLGGLGPAAILYGLVRGMNVLRAPEGDAPYGGAVLQFERPDGSLMEPEDSGAPPALVMAVRFMVAASNKDGDQINAIWNVYRLMQAAVWDVPDWQDSEIWRRGKARGI